MMIVKKIKLFVVKTLLCVILFLVVAIVCKSNGKIKSIIWDKVYGSNISFSYFNNFYNRYLGGIFPIESFSSNQQITQVFQEDLVYNHLISYEEGVALEVDDHYLIPVISDGIVVYIGDKEKYGKVIIVEGNSGINVWYGNVCNVNVRLYDYVDNGTYLGEVCSDILYLVFSKGNNYLDYEEYLK